MKEFYVGDKVVVKAFEQLPEAFRTRGAKKICGKDGVIVDKLYSQTREEFMYRVHREGFNTTWPAAALELYLEEPISWRVDVEVLHNAVVARCIEVKNSAERVVARGHAHILHDGVLGVVQAASFACRRLYEEVGGPSINGK